MIVTSNTVLASYAKDTGGNEGTFGTIVAIGGNGGSGGAGTGTGGQSTATGSATIENSPGVLCCITSFPQTIFIHFMPFF